jgi:hypothetical protein
LLAGIIHYSFLKWGSIFFVGLAFKAAAIGADEVDVVSDQLEIGPGLSLVVLFGLIQGPGDADLRAFVKVLCCGFGQAVEANDFNPAGFVTR